MGGSNSRRTVVTLGCTCPQGLTPFRSPNAGYSCNRCRKSVPTGSKLFGCRRCNFDVCGSCVTEQLGCTCPEGLKPFTTPNSTWSCSKCHQKFPMGSKLFGCRSCNFDVCGPCAVEHMSLKQPEGARSAGCTCPQGLKPFTTPSSTWNCSNCRRTVPIGTKLSGCRSPHAFWFCQK